MAMTEKRLFEKDSIPTSAGPLEITFLGHGSLLLFWNNLHIQVDPFSQVADYAHLPPAELILITHEHDDHLDPAALAHIRTAATAVVLTSACTKRVAGGIVMQNGDTRTVSGVPIAAVPAYNVAHKRPNGQPFHPRGIGNGYVLTLGDVRLYAAGDTEDIPEMKNLADIAVAFLPMNLPYTMTPEMVANAARAFRPKILYPYHYGNTDTQRLVALLRDEPGIEVRIRRMA
jgi:L-ascorbate metabolism protein UlaG (beta-lactamase superfamily)